MQYSRPAYMTDHMLAVETIQDTTECRK